MNHYVIELTSRRFFIMDATDYWLFAQEYSIWNTAVPALQFWTNDLDPQMLSCSIERFYTAFFCSDSALHLQYIEEEILFGHFMTTLNDAFEWELTLEDIGYESGSESFKCSHSSMLRTTSISCFDTRKVIFHTCHSQSMPIS